MTIKFLEVSDHPSFDNHEKVVACDDPATGLRALIAVHNTHLGPGVGGCRMYPYASIEAALHDVLRLSQGMTYKSAIHDLKFGGGKSVIMGDPRHQKTPDLLRRMGDFVDTLQGAYVVAEDMNISPADIAVMAERTRHVCALEQDGSSGNPSPFTAHGVYFALKTALLEKFGTASLGGVRVAVQGTGSVGLALCEYLHRDGARLFVADTHGETCALAAEKFNATPVNVNDVFSLDVDVFSPCAVGAILNDETVPQLNAAIVCGAANNQLASPRLGEDLQRQEILYCPDYVVNGGGIINIYYEFLPDSYSRARALLHVENIAAVLRNVLDIARDEGLSTAAAADRLAERKFRKGV